MTSERLLSATAVAVCQELRKLVQAVRVSCPISSVFLLTPLSLGRIEGGREAAVVEFGRRVLLF